MGPKGPEGPTLMVENTYKLHTAAHIKKHITYRNLSDVNTFLIDNFYQLPRVGGTAVMSAFRSQCDLELAMLSEMPRYKIQFNNAQEIVNTGPRFLV